jgi:hypothetical protein
MQSGNNYPWDGKLVQDLVKKRTQAFEKAVKQAEGITKRPRRSRELIESTNEVPNQQLLHPQFTRQDLIKLLRQCPSTDHRQWLNENIGLKYFSPVNGRIIPGTIASTITQEDLGWPDNVWEMIKPSSKTKMPIPPRLP